MTETPSLETLYRDTESVLAAMFAQFDVAEAEIAAAQAKYPDRRDLLHHAFPLLDPTHPRMTVDFIYRGHCRELVERVAAGADTRPATAAELSLAISQASLIAPFNHAAATLAFRMWRQAYGDDYQVIDAAQLAAYERTGGSAADDLERHARHRGRQPWRTLPKEIECDGKHNGDPVECRFAPASKGLLF